MKKVKILKCIILCLLRWLSQCNVSDLHSFTTIIINFVINVTILIFVEKFTQITKAQAFTFFYLPFEPPYIMFTKVVQYISIRTSDVSVIHKYKMYPHNVLKFQCGLTPVWILMFSLPLTKKWISGGGWVFFGLKKSPNSRLTADVV